VPGHRRAAYHRRRDLTAIITGCESGRDHDHDPVSWHAPQAGLEVGLSHYSRLRQPHASSASVMG
jgi:hypothetical protein